MRLSHLDWTLTVCSLVEKHVAKIPHSAGGHRNHHGPYAAAGKAKDGTGSYGLPYDVSSGDGK